MNINKIGLRQQITPTKGKIIKNVLELSYFNGYTHEEISRILNIPEGTVKTRLRNALIELRKNCVMDVKEYISSGHIEAYGAFARRKKSRHRKTAPAIPEINEAIIAFENETGKTICQ